MVKIKVCGITEIEQARALDDLGVDFIGFIYYEKSPRFVLNHLTENEIKNIKGSFKKTGVFVNESVDEILKTVKNCNLDLVQLHGTESAEFCKQISEKVAIIKAFSIDEQSNIELIIRDYQNVVNYFLFDTVTKKYGGSGEKFNWKILENQLIGKPFFLSGGIGVEDTTSLISLRNQNNIKNLFALDINSKFEIQAGVKNIPLIEKFLKQFKIGKQ